MASCLLNPHARSKRARLGRAFLSEAGDRVLANQLSHSFNEANAGSQIDAEETAVGRFICAPTPCTKTKIDGAWCELAKFEMIAAAHDNYPVERVAPSNTNQRTHRWRGDSLSLRPWS